MWKKSMVRRISKQPFPVHILIVQKQFQNVNISTIWIAGKQIMQDVHVKLNPGFS